MSGGSFNYLCFKDAEQLLAGANYEEIREMESALREEGFEDAADATKEIIDIVEKASVDLNAKVANMVDVWKAMEWWHSGDWGEDRAEEIINEWSNRQEAKG